MLLRPSASGFWSGMSDQFSRLQLMNTNFSGSLVVPLLVSKLNQPWHCSAVSKKEVSRLNCERLPIDLGALFLRTCSVLKKITPPLSNPAWLYRVYIIHIYSLYLRIYYWFILGIITIIVIVVQYHNIRYLQIKQPPPKKKHMHTHTQRLHLVTCTISVIPASSWLSWYLRKRKHFRTQYAGNAQLSSAQNDPTYKYNESDIPTFMISYLWWLMDISISKICFLNVDICDWQAYPHRIPARGRPSG